MATGSPQTFRAVDQRLLLGGGNIIRYGLVVVIVWIGALKFTASEATRIQPFIEHSPFMFWLNGVFSVRALAAVLGTIEISAGVLIALRPWLPLPTADGSGVAALVFIGTLSFLFTTPGVPDAAAGGFPALSSVGQFLLKDLVLLGASVWTLGESLSASAARAHGRSRPTRVRRPPTGRATASH